MKKLVSITLLIFSALMMVSCSETDETSTEFSNWQARNDDFFTKVYNMAKDSIAAGKTNWKIIGKYTKGDSTAITSYIVVKVLAEGNTSDLSSPIFTDTVAVDYSGHLMPTDTYNSRPYASYPTNVGYNFQKTWTGDYDLTTMKPTKLCGNIIGMDTALMNMHRGDRWLIYIPYQIGYYTTEKTGIPAYSTLIFDATLVDFWHPNKKS